MPGKWWAFGVVAAGALASTLDMGSVALALPRLASVFRVDVSTALWVGIFYLLTSTALLFPMGWLGDRQGRRRVMALGFLILSAGLLLCSLAPTFPALLVGRGVQAVGNAMVLANSNAVVVSAFPPEERGRAIGLRGAVVGLGLGAGPLLGGGLLDLLDWRALFYTRLPLGVVGAGLAWAILRDSSRQASAPPDWLGALALFGGMGGFLLAVHQAGRGDLLSPLAGAGVAAAVLLLPAFILVERRVPEPVLDLSLFRSLDFSRAVGSLVLAYLGWGMVAYLTPFYLLTGLAMPATLAGVIMSAFQFVRVVMGPVGGVLADRLGPRLPSGVGLLLLSVGIFLLSRMGPSPSLVALAGSLVVGGIGSALFDPPNTALVLSSAPVHRLGTASAAVPAGRQTAMSIGAALGGALLALRQGVYTPLLPPAEAVARGVGDTLLVGAIFVALGIFTASFLGLRWRRPAPS